jgi:hypothetical protein
MGAHSRPAAIRLFLNNLHSFNTYSPFKTIDELLHQFGQIPGKIDNGAM